MGKRGAYPDKQLLDKVIGVLRDNADHFQGDEIERMQHLFQGVIGESTVRAFVMRNGRKLMQVDLLTYKSRPKWKSGEIKHQAKYTQKPPPEHPNWPEGPFDGHGLPSWQIQRRIELYKDTGIEPILYIIDSEDGYMYFQSLIKLEDGEHFDTQGRKPRRIYPICNFLKIPYQELHKQNPNPFEERGIFID